MATELAPITPSVLMWARQSIGVSVEEAARRAAVSPERIVEWESGEAEPTVAKLRQLAKLYQRPLAVFFLPEPPTDFAVIRDFRRLPGRRDHTWSRALHKIYRRAVFQQEITRELAELDADTQQATVPSIDRTTPPDTAADTARTALGVGLDEQFGWRTPEEAFSGWQQAVESLGVLVLRTSDVPVSEMRGFSLGGRQVPVIVLNALDAPRGQVFTLAHEFAHLMLRQEGLCDLLEQQSGLDRDIEMWCNATAGALLMPTHSFLADDVVGSQGPREWEEDSLAHLSQRYGVSREAVLRRLVSLNRASWDFYLTRRAEYLAAYEERREEERAHRRSSRGGPPPHRMAIRDRGKPYVRLVLDAYHQEAITASSVSNLLGLKLKHLEALEREASE